MPKVGMEPIRRAQLVEATFECIHRYGFSGTTFGKVSQLSGLSTGTICHYFRNKDELLEATMREFLRQLDHVGVVGEHADNVPHSQILAIIDSNFSPRLVAPNIISTWLAFWAEAPHIPALKRLQKVSMKRLRSNLRYWLKQLLPKDKASVIADGLASLIDGLWLQGAFQEGGMDSDKARRICRDYLDSQLSSIVDGLWLQGVFRAGGVEPGKARRLCQDYLGLPMVSNPSLRCK